MRVRRVTAHAFGPLVGASLELADGLTVVHGPNESGKSSWHAAMTAAICGLRRGRRDEDFERFRPWDRPDWAVSAEIVLADGRHVELRQDLDGRVDCYARDLDLGRNYSAEITGSERGEVPDASRWLGLERRTFRATASVAQAQLAAMAARDNTEAARDNDALRDLVQRAAATAGADETAATALTRLDEYRRANVGTETSRIRPLQRAEAERRAAEEALLAARRDHAELERLAVSARQLRQEAEGIDQTVRGREAEVARANAASLRSRATEAAELSQLIAASGGGDLDPSAISAADVSAAVAAWRALPDPVAPAEPLRTDDEELVELARSLESGLGAVEDPALAERVATSTRVVERARRRALISLIAGLLLIVGAVPAVALNARLTALFAAIGLLLLVLAVVASRQGSRARDGRDRTRTELTAHQDRVAGLRTAAEAARRRCAELGLPADPAVLRLRLARRAGPDNDEAWRHEWEQARQRAEARLAATATALGLPAASALSTLEKWLADEPARVQRRDQVRDWRTRLAVVLGGSTLDNLIGQADSADRVVESTSVHVTADPRLDRSDADLRRAYDEAVQHAAAQEAALAAHARSATPVAEAEECLAAAAAELDRVRDLDRILGLTRGFLADAQDRVYRDIAPRLAHAVGRDLAAVTGGRYTEAIVNPDTLTVSVRAEGGPLREADALSYGTTEQVYLLLRVALAEHLVREGESCPLLLDDVTVHADPARTRAILDLLLRVAERHQVVLFSQQDDVRRWAEATLTTPRHALRPLAPLPT